MITRDIDSDLQKVVCDRCGDKFSAREWRIAGTVIVPRSRHCDDCLDVLFEDQENRRKKEALLRKQRLLADRWEELCPPLYREWKPELSPLTEESRDLLRKSWKDLVSARNVFIQGQSGCNKTFAAYRLAKAKLLIVPPPGSTCFVDSAALRTMIMPTDDKDRRRKAEKALDEAMGCQLTIIDDFGQTASSSEAAAEKVLTILEERTKELRSTIITSQYPIDKIAHRFGGNEIGQAIARRIADYFTSITLSK